jgi:hypothetical protein
VVARQLPHADSGEDGRTETCAMDMLERGVNTTYGIDWIGCPPTLHQPSVNKIARVASQKPPFNHPRAVGGPPLQDPPLGFIRSTPTSLVSFSLRQRWQVPITTYASLTRERHRDDWICTSDSSQNKIACSKDFNSRNYIRVFGTQFDRYHDTVQAHHLR